MDSVIYQIYKNIILICSEESSEESSYESSEESSYEFIVNDNCDKHNKIYNKGIGMLSKYIDTNMLKSFYYSNHKTYPKIYFTLDFTKVAS